MWDSLGSNLDELLDELNSFAEHGAQQHLSHHPQLDLITALQQQLQRRSVAAATVAAEGEIDKLLLLKKKIQHAFSEAEPGVSYFLFRSRS